MAQHLVRLEGIMAKFLPALIVAGLLVITGWLVWGSINPEAKPALGGATSTLNTAGKDPESGSVPVSHECNGDGKRCDDGSIVGRTGPLCEFAACPKTDEKTGTIKTTIGQKMTALNVSITPHAVIDDSRCPTDVQCIWAGTAHVSATVAMGGGTTEETFELGKPLSIGGVSITLSELQPAKTPGEEIPVSSYRLTFLLSRP